MLNVKLKLSVQDKNFMLNFANLNNFGTKFKVYISNTYFYKREFLLNTDDIKCALFYSCNN